jgi:mannose-1-phosphate guanylyltransferase
LRQHTQVPGAVIADVAREHDKIGPGMKAILLAGGLGTRLRPLTLNTPKPVVPIFDRPFLYYQIDLLRQIPEIDEVILSLNYQPERIEAMVGDGAAAGVRLRYVVEPSPRGTGGAVKFAEPYLDDTVIVFNGDVLTEIDLPAVLRLHRERAARATIVLTPVENPSAYGLVETDADGNVVRFLEKPSPDEITCDTINAGIYILEPETFDRIPEDTNYSIERMYFPSLVERGETFVAHINRGYWLDIGTPAKYIQGHRDIMDGRCRAEPFASAGAGAAVIASDATIHPSATIEGPCFIGAGARIDAGVTVTAHTAVGAGSHVRTGATLDRAILWPDAVIGANARVTRSVLGHGCRVEEHASLGPDLMLGDGSHVTAHSKLPILSDDV